MTQPPVGEEPQPVAAAALLFPGDLMSAPLEGLNQPTWRGMGINGGTGVGLVEQPTILLLGDPAGIQRPACRSQNAGSQRKPGRLSARAGRPRSAKRPAGARSARGLGRPA